jgi:hypothetical protein
VHGLQAFAAIAAAGRGPRVYERHDPFAQSLHQVVRENLATFYAAIEEGWESRLPEFVRAEFAGYLDCGVLQRGFAHLACEDCGLPRLVAAHADTRPSLFHFRTSAGHEVDLVLENRRHELVGIEIKASTTVGESDFRGLRGFADLVGKRLRTGVLLHAGNQTLPFGGRMWAIPIDSLWSQREI